MVFRQLTRYQGGGVGAGILADNFNAVAAQEFLISSTGISLELGKIARITQASQAPADYLADKKKIIKGCIQGVDNAGGQWLTRLGSDPGAAVPGEVNLAVALPGAANATMPQMTALGTEFLNAYTRLTSSGVPNEIAKVRAGEEAKIILQNRLADFSLVFPGLADDAFVSRNNLASQTKYNNLATQGLQPDAPIQMRNVKSRKRNKKYKQGATIREIN